VVEELIVTGDRDNLFEKAMDWMGFDGHFGYNGAADREWLWDSFRDNLSDARDNVQDFVADAKAVFDSAWDSILDFVTRDTSDAYNPSGPAQATTDQTSSKVASSEEAAANRNAMLVASMQNGAAVTAGAGTPGMMPIERQAYWMQTHPGWMNQDSQYWPVLSDFSAGGLLHDNYGPGAPYSVTR
jgi:hypothetical protein